MICLGRQSMTRAGRAGQQLERRSRVTPLRQDAEPRVLDAVS